MAIDNNETWVSDILSKGFTSIEPGLQEIIQQTINSGQLQVSHQLQAVAGSEVVIVCIPLSIDASQKVYAKPFLHSITQLAPYLQKQTVLIIETSVPVGFCKNEIVATLNAAGKVHGRDYYLAASPERIKSGTMLQQLLQVPKAIGGFDEEAGNVAYDVYKNYFSQEQLVLLPSLESAELMKLAGMIYRDVNIALSNQLAMYANALKVNFTDLIPLINADREANLLQPGIGVAGHCTPVYPYFLIENFKQQSLDFSLAATGRGINEGMPSYALQSLLPQLKRKKVLLLGLSFRSQVKEDARSIAYAVRDLLMEQNVSCSLHDPLYSKEEIEEKGFEYCGDIYQSDAEAIVIITMHGEYRHIDWKKMAAQKLRFVVDGRNALHVPSVTGAGIQYFGIGKTG